VNQSSNPRGHARVVSVFRRERTQESSGRQTLEAPTIPFNPRSVRISRSFASPSAISSTQASCQKEPIGSGAKERKDGSTMVLENALWQVNRRELESVRAPGMPTVVMPGSWTERQRTKWGFPGATQNTSLQPRGGSVRSSSGLNNPSAGTKGFKSYGARKHLAP